MTGTKVSKNLSPVKLRPTEEIYSNLSEIKTMITSQIHFHVNDNSADIMKFPPIIAKKCEKRSFDLIRFHQKSEDQQ